MAIFLKYGLGLTVFSVVSSLAAESTPMPLYEIKADSYYVDCSKGDDSNAGNQPSVPFATIQRAVNESLRSSAHTIYVSGGICSITETVDIVQAHALRLVGDGKSAISGGRILTQWKSMEGANLKRMYRPTFLLKKSRC